MSSVKNDRVKLSPAFVIPVAGVSYRQGVVRSLSPGDWVRLKREPDNEWDPNAVAFYTMNGDFFGYVPRDILPKRFADRAIERWGGRVVEVLPSEGSWGVRVEICYANIDDFDTKPKNSSFIDASDVKDQIEAELTPSEEVPHSIAFSKSGRILGYVSEPVGQSALVRVTPTGGGEPRMYPVSVVVLEEIKSSEVPGN